MPTDEELKQQAADKLEELDTTIVEQNEVVLLAHAELNRIYEITAIFHTVICAYLDSHPDPADEEEQGALNTIIDARYAVENNCTVSEARLIREEALVE